MLTWKLRCSLLTRTKNHTISSSSFFYRLLQRFIFISFLFQLYLTFFLLFCWFLFVQNPEQKYTLKKYKTIWWARCILARNSHGFRSRLTTGGQKSKVGGQNGFVFRFRIMCMNQINERKLSYHRNQKFWRSNFQISRYLILKIDLKNFLTCTSKGCALIPYLY